TWSSIPILPLIYLGHTIKLVWTDCAGLCWNLAAQRLGEQPHADSHSAGQFSASFGSFTQPCTQWLHKADYKLQRIPEGARSDAGANEPREPLIPRTEWDKLRKSSDHTNPRLTRQRPACLGNGGSLAAPFSGDPERAAAAARTSTGTAPSKRARRRGACPSLLRQERVRVGTVAGKESGFPAGIVEKGRPRGPAGVSLVVFHAGARKRALLRVGMLEAARSCFAFPWVGRCAPLLRASPARPSPWPRGNDEQRRAREMNAIPPPCLPPRLRHSALPPGVWVSPSSPISLFLALAPTSSLARARL
uniref:Uncharacterized protein n=1 Tax=Varanus komodoensis TaxID=61221 RepID=A0A8D2L4U6_VARKO